MEKQLEKSMGMCFLHEIKERNKKVDFYLTILTIFFLTILWKVYFQVSEL